MHFHEAQNKETKIMTIKAINKGTPKNTIFTFVFSLKAIPGSIKT